MDEDTFLALFANAARASIIHCHPEQHPKAFMTKPFLAQEACCQTQRSLMRRGDRGSGVQTRHVRRALAGVSSGAQAVEGPRRAR